jgi:O-antigen/teichoic acid export membrane protein
MPEDPSEASRVKLTPAARRLGGVTVAEILSRAVGFIALPFVARALGPTEFGSLAFAVAITSWVGVLMAPGLYAFGLRQVAQDPAAVRTTVGELVRLSLTLTLLAYAGILAFALLADIPPVERALLLITGATLPVSSINLSWAFIGLSRAGAVSVLTLVTNVFYVVFVVWLVRVPEDVVLVASLQLLQFLLIAIGLLVIAYRNWGHVRFTLSRARALTILRGAVPLGLGTVMTMVYNRIDLVMVAEMRGRTEAGLYGGAYRIMEVAVLLPVTLLSIAIIPSITGAFGQDPAGAARKVEVYFRHFLVLAVPVIVGGILLRHDIVAIVLGPQFLAASNVFGVLCLNLIVAGSASLFAGCVLVGLRRNATYLAAVAAGAVVNVGLNLVFIPRFGMVAAAVATLAAQAAVALFAFGNVRITLGAGPEWLRYLPKPILAGAAMAVPILLLRDGVGGFVLAGTASVVTYCVFILALRGVDLRVLSTRI